MLTLSQTRWQQPCPAGRQRGKPGQGRDGRVSRQRQEAKHQRGQALALHGHGGELAAELSAWPLASSVGLPKGLVRMMKACNPVLP